MNLTDNQIETLARIRDGRKFVYGHLAILLEEGLVDRDNGGHVGITEQGAQALVLAGRPEDPRLINFIRQARANGVSAREVEEALTVTVVEKPFEPTFEKLLNARDLWKDTTPAQKAAIREQARLALARLDYDDTRELRTFHADIDMVRSYLTDLEDRRS